MVLALNKTPKLVNANGTRLRQGAAKVAMFGRAAESAKRSVARAKDDLMAKRAKLMLAAKMNIYITPEVPAGKFTIVDPSTMDDGERLHCPFKAKTVVLHPDDIDQAIEHFAKEGQN